MLITDDQLSAALTLLAETAEPLGRAVGHKVGQEEAAAIRKAEAFLATSAVREDDKPLTVAEREARARCSEGYREAMRLYVQACQEEATIRARRIHAEAVIACWQTLSANNRARNV